MKWRATSDWILCIFIFPAERFHATLSQFPHVPSPEAPMIRLSIFLCFCRFWVSCGVSFIPSWSSIYAWVHWWYRRWSLWFSWAKTSPCLELSLWLRAFYRFSSLDYSALPDRRSYTLGSIQVGHRPWAQNDPNSQPIPDWWPRFWAGSSRGSYWAAVPLRLL